MSSDREGMWIETKAFFICNKHQKLTNRSEKAGINLIDIFILLSKLQKVVIKIDIFLKSI